MNDMNKLVPIKVNLERNGRRNYQHTLCISIIQHIQKHNFTHQLTLLELKQLFDL